MDGDQVVGVQCDREGGDVYADVVVLADGVNSTLARKAGFHGELSSKPATSRWRSRKSSSCRRKPSRAASTSARNPAS